MDGCLAQVAWGGWTGGPRVLPLGGPPEAWLLPGKATVLGISVSLSQRRPVHLGGELRGSLMEHPAFLPGRPTGYGGS